ncbi:MAG: LON peptidase substrate-binding domain-containing protein [Spongiibacteraceae bacterium]|nr:LON peptidase substrate-binding domain-containing protein [Spongiibacteraceae bacterium]
MMNVTIPLFPLSAVLLPHGRMPLQIFEPRYLDLVSECLKTDTGFGVVWLSQGSEVLTKPTQNSVNGTYANIGTYAKIVDWDKLSNGLLGITVEGEKKFRLLSSQKKSKSSTCSRYRMDCR